MGNSLLRVVSGILPAIFFLRSVHAFLKSDWNSDFGHDETGNGQKSERFCRVKNFRHNFKLE